MSPKYSAWCCTPRAQSSSLHPSILYDLASSSSRTLSPTFSQLSLSDVMVSSIFLSKMSLCSTFPFTASSRQLPVASTMSPWVRLIPILAPVLMAALTMERAMAWLGVVTVSVFAVWVPHCRSSAPEHLELEFQTKVREDFTITEKAP